MMMTQKLALFVSLPIALLGVFLSVSLSALPAHCQTQTRDEELEALRARIQKLEQDAAKPSETRSELTQLQLDLLLPDPLGVGFTGLGPAASKVYTSRTPISLGALAEAKFRSEDGAESETAVTAANIFFGARLTKKLIFNSSFSLEDRTPTNSNNSHIQFAYVDFLLGEESGIRAGNFLIPFGVTNLRFEPTLFPMVNRPRAERLIIPTDWNENGVLGFYRVGPVLIQAGVMNAGDISTAQSESWIREGRQGGSGAKSGKVGYVARVETNARRLPSGRPAPSIGASIYSGSWSQDENALYGDANVVMGEVHAGASWKRVKAEALYVEGSLSNAERISNSLARGIGSKARGATVTLQYDLLPPEAHKTSVLGGTDPKNSLYHELPIFVAYEVADAQASLPAGFVADVNSRISSWTFGLNYLPHEQVVVKADYVMSYDRNDHEGRSFETSIGITF